MTQQLLIVDDDTELCQLLTDFLELEGFAITSVHNGDTALQVYNEKNYDLIVLDIMLPGKQGLDVLRAIRTESNIPVVMLTARGDDTDRILGLELGADDYVPKPCNPQELAARIRAVLRRSQVATSQNGNSTLRSGQLSLDPTRRELYCEQQVIHLTSTEFEILHLLMQRAGQVVDKETISLDVLKRKLAAYDRSIDVHISNIRKKLGQFGIEDDLIKNIRGVGYQYTQTVTSEQQGS